MPSPSEKHCFHTYSSKPVCNRTQRPRGGKPFSSAGLLVPSHSALLLTYFLSPYCAQTYVFIPCFELFTDIPAGLHHHDHLVHTKWTIKLVESLGPRTPKGHVPPLPPESVGPESMNAGELFLSLTDCNTWESRTCTSSGQHSEAGCGGMGAGALPWGRGDEIMKTDPTSCQWQPSQSHAGKGTLVVWVRESLQDDQLS